MASFLLARLVPRGPTEIDSGRSESSRGRETQSNSFSFHLSQHHDRPHSCVSRRVSRPRIASSHHSLLSAHPSQSCSLTREATLKSSRTRKPSAVPTQRSSMMCVYASIVVHTGLAHLSPPYPHARRSWPSTKTGPKQTMLPTSSPKKSTPSNARSRQRRRQSRTPMRSWQRRRVSTRSWLSSSPRSRRRSRS